MAHVRSRLRAFSISLRLLAAGLAACAAVPEPAAPGGPGAPPGRACTEMGCVDGLTVDVASPSGWAPGTYRFDIEADGAKTTCEIALPLPACEASPAARCTGPVQVQIAESGCALPASAHSLPEIAFPKAPARVRIDVSRDGAQLASEQLAPQYRTVQPNGPECGPTCNQARAAMTLR